MTGQQPPRWYVLNTMHMATLCAGKDDAEACAAEYDQQYPLRAPHRVVQLIDVSELEAERTARIEAQVENDALKAPPTGKTLSTDYVALKACQAGIDAVTPEITLFAELLTRSERAARIAAQVENEALKAERARSGLVRWRAVREAVAAEREACAVACRSLQPPESCTGVEKSLWDVATMACEEAILARYNE